VITGIGWIAPATLADALAGRLTAPPEPTPEITAFELPDGCPTWGFEVLDLHLDKELPNIKSFVDRTSALALVAAKRALSDAALLERDHRPKNVEIGCAYGSTLGCLEAMGIFWNKVKSSSPKFAPPLPFTHGYPNSPSSLLCIEFGLRGAAATFTGEKLAGVEALMFAFDHIASGSADIILAGASESLSAAAYRHLLATGQLSKSGKWDDGIVPGEGAVMLVLESESSAKARKMRIHADLEGINFFPLAPQPNLPKGNVRSDSDGDSISVGTNPHETVNFVSTPNVHPLGGWIQPLRISDMAAVATKFYSGDMLSVSPVLGAALAAGTLGGSVKIALKDGEAGLPCLRKVADVSSLKYSVATGFEPSGRLGTVLLKRFAEVGASGIWPRVGN
jgi:hypothetical protein